MSDLLRVIDGGRETLERKALVAIFQAPDQFPAMLNQLTSPANADLHLVNNTSQASRANDQSFEKDSP